MDSQNLLNDVLRRFRIDIEHSNEAHAEVDYWQANPNIEDSSLQDWSALAFVTIDNPDSRDLDQALLIEPIQGGGFRCRYALADAAFYVKPGSALFTDALERGSSYYLPGRSIPMLPVALSEDLISLNPNVKRRALVFDMTLSEEGECTHTAIVRATICSQAKLSYEGVQRWLDDAPAEHDPIVPSNTVESLRLLKVLGLKLIRQAENRDVIQFDRRETEIRVSSKGFELHERERYDTERYNEQLSLLCNMQGASLLQSMDRTHDDLQPIFRVHEAPLKSRRKSLESNLAKLIEIRQLDDRFKRQPDQSLADYIAALPEDAKAMRLVQAIERQVLMINQASQFRAEAGRHHALGADSYARFSSPMREVVGIYTHKEILEALGEEQAMDSAEDAVLREQIIEAANGAKQRQKQIRKAVEFAVIQDHLKHDLEHASPHTHAGTVMGFRSGRIYISIDDLAVDLKVYLDDLNQQYDTVYSLTDVSAEPQAAGKPQFVLGDSVEINVRAFDAQKQRFQLNLFWLA